MVRELFRVVASVLKVVFKHGGMCSFVAVKRRWQDSGDLLGLTYLND